MFSKQEDIETVKQTVSPLTGHDVYTQPEGVVYALSQGGGASNARHRWSLTI